MTDTAARPGLPATDLPAYIPLNRERLIAPGPVEVDPRVLLELAQPQMHHRAAAGIEKLMEARAKLTQLLGDPYDAVITTSSGTGAFEGALVSLVPEGAKVVNAQAGKFSERWGEMAVSGSQKGTATPPGLGFVLFSPEIQARLIKNTPRGFYLDMHRELTGQKAGSTPQTPAINLIYALSLSLERLLCVPLEVLWAEKRRQADALIAAGTALGAPAWAARTSPAVAVLTPPAGITGRQVSARLAEMGQRALPGQAPHEDTVFRVSTMGYADRYDALAIAGILEECFASLGVSVERGAAVQAAWGALRV
jgi:aspartate aminotransferase-like enzyme